MESVHKRLHQFPAGSLVRIEQLCDCPKARGRLCALGLTPGTTVEVCSGGPGPCLLKVRGCSVAIGHGMADRVLGSIVNGNGTRRHGSCNTDMVQVCPRCSEKSSRANSARGGTPESTPLEEDREN